MLIEWSTVGVGLGEDGKSDFSCGWREGFRLLRGGFLVFWGVAGDLPALMMVGSPLSFPLSLFGAWQYLSQENGGVNSSWVYGVVNASVGSFELDRKKFFFL